MNKEPTLLRPTPASLIQVLKQNALFELAVILNQKGNRFNQIRSGAIFRHQLDRGNQQASL